MSGRPIMIVVAHSSASQGAESPPEEDGSGGIAEYAVSLRASLAAFGDLAGDFPCVLYDAGPHPASEYDDLKVEAVNDVEPRLAVEIHCNASTNEEASFAEVLHRAGSVHGAAAAWAVANALGDGYRQGLHKAWRSRGARANTVEKDRHLLFFLERTHAPAIIVEGAFISNVEQARWLASEGGAEAYGLLVAEGIRRWIDGL